MVFLCVRYQDVGGCGPEFTSVPIAADAVKLFKNLKAEAVTFSLNLVILNYFKGSINIY